MTQLSNVLITDSKGQIISKHFFSGRGFSQKTNENMSHTSKNEFICSFFGRILGLTIFFEINWPLKKSNVHPHQSNITLHTLPWDTLTLCEKNKIFGRNLQLKKSQRFLWNHTECGFDTFLIYIPLDYFWLFDLLDSTCYRLPWRLSWDRIIFKFDHFSWFLSKNRLVFAFLHFDLTCFCPVRDIKNRILQSSNSPILEFKLLENAFKIKKRGLK